MTRPSVRPPQVDPSASSRKAATEAGRQPPLPLEVLAFAKEQGIADYLPPVLAMTRQLFPDREVGVFLDNDPDIPDDWHIVFAVDVTEWSVERIVDAQCRWAQEIFDHCPSTHVHLFRYALRARA